MLYYDYVYEFDYFTLAIPFMFSIVVFYITYWAFFKSFSHRIRHKKLVSRYVDIFSSAFNSVTFSVRFYFITYPDSLLYLWAII